MSYRPLPNFLTISESKIEGLGLFTRIEIEKSQFIGITHVYNEKFENNYIRTPLGGFINHRNTANCELIQSTEGNLKLYTIKKILPNEELTVKYKMYSDF